MSFLIIAYAIVAFVAGVIALAMPCCFSVLLPSYFAQSFKQRSKLIGMTAIFSLGIASVMLPIALGVVYLAQTVLANHNLIFVAGGFLMILIGFLTLWGQGMLPMLNFPVNLNKNNVASVYTLGLFSGAATSCCAPVLAGVLVLTALSTSMLEGVLVGFFYVLGMTSPLLTAATLWDRFSASGENPLKGRMLQFKLAGREVSVHSSKLVAGLMFIVMGFVTIALGLTGTMIQSPGAALLGVMQAGLTRYIVQVFSSTSPEVFLVVLAVGLALLAGGIISVRMKAGRRVREGHIASSE